MNRIALLACLAASACAASARPIPAPEPTPQRYTLADIESHDCGLMCSFHSPPPSRHVSGALEIRGAAATLTLHASFFQSVVLCPSVGPLDPMTPCVKADDPRASPKTLLSDMQLHGSVVRVGSTMSLSFTHDGGQLELRCRDTGASLDCAKTAATTADTRDWLGLPDHVAFAPPRIPVEVRPAVKAAVSTL